MKWRTRRIIDNLWGPSGSVFIHILLLLLLTHLVGTKVREMGQEVEVEIMKVESPPDLEEATPELEELTDIPTVVDAVAPPDVSIDQPPAVEAVGVTASASAVDVTELGVVEQVSSLKIPGLYAGRTVSGRAGALGKYSGGMGGRTEYAVLKALRWLRNHQYPDGSWGPHYRTALTGLALLAFLAHGETPGSPEFGTAVAKGLQYLLGRQGQDGVFDGGGPIDYWYSPVRLSDQLRCYEHAIGTYAICESYSLTGIPFLKSSMERAIQVMIDGQHEGGGWDYGYIHGPKSHVDVSLGGWHVQALKAAVTAGAENPGLKAAIETAVRGVKRMTTKQKGGLFQYSTRNEEHPPDVIMTGVAVLCLQLTGHDSDEETKDGVKALRTLKVRWSKEDKAGQDDRGVGDWPMYAWYYITQARFHFGGQTWFSWNQSFAPVLCEMQNADGSWCPAPNTEEARFGPVYCTSLSALMLEVYYRILPTYQPVKTDSEPSIEELEDGEISIRFG